MVSLIKYIIKSLKFCDGKLYLLQFIINKIFLHEQVSEMCEPLVTDICMSLKPLRFKDGPIKNGNIENDPLAMGTTLFELYLVLQRFSM